MDRSEPSFCKKYLTCVFYPTRYLEAKFGRKRGQNTFSTKIFHQISLGLNLIYVTHSALKYLRCTTRSREVMSGAGRRAFFSICSEVADTNPCLASSPAPMLEQNFSSQTRPWVETWVGLQSFRLTLDLSPTLHKNALVVGVVLPLHRGEALFS